MFKCKLCKKKKKKCICDPCDKCGKKPSKCKCPTASTAPPPPPPTMTQNSSQSGVRQLTEAEVTLQNQIATGHLAKLDPNVFEIWLPDKHNWTDLRVRLSVPKTSTVEDGFKNMWGGMKYVFKMTLKTEKPDSYPFREPDVHVAPGYKIWHPNILPTGQMDVCLGLTGKNIHKPQHGIHFSLYQMMAIFKDPNPDDPQNHEAAEQMREDDRNKTNKFEQGVKRANKGQSVQYKGNTMQFPTQAQMNSCSESSMPSGGMWVFNKQIHAQMQKNLESKGK